MFRLFSKQVNGRGLITKAFPSDFRTSITHIFALKAVDFLCKNINKHDQNNVLITFIQQLLRMKNTIRRFIK